MSGIVLTQRVRGPLAAILSVLLVFSPHSVIAQSAVAPAQASAQELHSKYSEADFAKLRELIGNTPLERMDMNFFKEVYRYGHAPDMLKAIFSRPELRDKSFRLAELRKYYDWSIQAQFARKNFVAIENTNQGKSNGSRSDLDATGNILDFDPAKGDWGLRKRVAELIQFQKEHYGKDGLTPDGTDVTIFNGDVFLPDWREARMGFGEFADQLLKNTGELKNRKGAYYVPGANKEQTHDRALAEGHTVHIGWDYVAGRPSVNGRPIEFNQETGKVEWLEFNKVTGEYKFRGPIEELITKQAAARGEIVRYQGVDVLAPSERWRRALGNIVQNIKEFFDPHDPVGRNKYFIERVIDQGVGRFTHLDAGSHAITGDLDTPPTYVEIHSADPQRFGGPEKAAWKKAYIQQGFGLADGDPKVAEIQSVLDRSAEIQLDKTKNRASYQDRAKHAAGEQFYFREEWAQAVASTVEAVRELEAKAAAEGRQVPVAEITRLQELEAERLFVDKQRRIIPEAAVSVIQETFRREQTAPKKGLFADPEVQAKINFERGTEIALLLDVIESSPLAPAERDTLRRRVIESVPESSRGLIAKIAELAGLKLKLTGRQGLGLERYTKASDGISDRPLWQEVSEILGVDSGGPRVPDDVIQKKFREAVLRNLGPVDAARFEEAWKVSRTALIAKFGAKAYWNEITAQADPIMAVGAALGLIHAYQQNCIGQPSESDACLAGLAWETGNQILYMLPYINSAYMILNGAKELKEGRKLEGALSMSLGVLSIPELAGAVGATGGMFIHIFVGYQILSLGKAVTYGYAMQTIENDAIEQAFKALKEPGKQARPFPAANRSGVFSGDTPTIPLLSDVITGKDDQGHNLVPAENYTDAQRNQEALVKSAPAIKSELEQLGLKENTPEWATKRSELSVRYGMMLPYLQRTAKIYQVFGPKVPASTTEADDLMPSCLDRIDEDVERKYAGDPSLYNRVRYRWNPANKNKDKQKDLSAGWSECVERTMKADKSVLGPVFDEYLNSWFAKQSSGYALDHDTAEFRARLRTALLREYVVHRYMDQGHENERQMKKALNAAKQQSAATLEVMGRILSKEQVHTQQLSEQLGRVVTTAQPAVKPQLVLRAPPYAVRIGERAPIEVSARGEYGTDDSAAKAWKADLDGEVVKVSLAVPDNILITPELRLELSLEPGKRPKRLVTIEEKLRARLKDGSGTVLATAETTARYYDVIEWEGAINVEVRAAGPETKNAADPRQTSPYPYALVKLSGPVQAQKESANSGYAEGAAVAEFRSLPDGSFKIHVAPRSTDFFHGPAETNVALAGIAEGPGEAGKPTILLGDGTQSATVVLPYTPPPSQTRNAPPKPQPQTASAPEPSGGNPGSRTPTTGEPPAVDTQLIADCDALLRAARAALAGRNLSRVTSLLNDAAQRKCFGSTVAGQLDGVRGEVEKNQNEHTSAIRQLIEAITQQMNSCQYEAALATARQLSDADPAHPFVAANLARLEQLAALQVSINSLLAEAADPVNDAEARATLARLRQIQGQAPPCLMPLITNAIARLDGRVTGSSIRDRIRAAMAACDYIKALAAALELQAAAPNDAWLAANLGRLQALAAEQSNIRTLLSQAKSTPPGPGSSELAARIRQALSTAPSCMAGEIHGVLAEIERGGGQKPAWLDTPSQPGSQTSANDNLNRAREILQHNTQDETDRVTRLARQERVVPANPPAQPQPDPVKDPPKRDPPARREPSPSSGRTQQTLNNLATTLGGVLAGKSIPQIPAATGSSAGSTSAPDPFVGSWMCQMKLISSRKMALDGSVQGDFRETISRRGNGYVLIDGRSGSTMPSTFVSGNSIRFGSSGGMAVDFRADGNRMTGTLRGASDEDVFMASLTCSR